MPRRNGTIEGVGIGRPRDPQIDAAVLDATLAVLDESGYGGLTLEEVARRAGTTKPAIYRRWPNRQRLVLAALGQRLGEARAPDTGCTLCDLDECLKLFVAAFRRMPPDVLGPLFADCAGDPELRAAFMTTLFDPPRAAVKETLDRAHARGDLRDGRRPRADPRPDRLAGPLPRPVRARADERRRDRARGRGAAAGHRRPTTRALLEHSRRVSGDPELHHLHA